MSIRKRIAFIAILGVAVCFADQTYAEKKRVTPRLPRQTYFNFPQLRKVRCDIVYEAIGEGFPPYDVNATADERTEWSAARMRLARKLELFANSQGPKQVAQIKSVREAFQRSLAAYRNLTIRAHERLRQTWWTLYSALPVNDKLRRQKATKNAAPEIQTLKQILTDQLAEYRKIQNQLELHPRAQTEYLILGHEEVMPLLEESIHLLDTHPEDERLTQILELIESKGG